MASIYEPLLRALQLQKAGSLAAFEEIAEIAGRVFGAEKFRDEMLTGAQVSAVERILREWTEMFADTPGRLDALETLIEVLRDIRRRPNDADLHLEHTKNWIHLMSLRGPGADVVLRTCSACCTEYVAISFGSFISGTESVLACNTCGHIRVDATEQSASSRCRCGGTLHRGCPSCGARKYEEKWMARPYDYFATHTFDFGATAS